MLTICCAECLEALKFDNMFTRRNHVSAAITGTNRWFLTHQSFLSWRKLSSGLLWIQGKPGSGKSVLAKSILASETVTAPSSDRPLVASWFYSKRGGADGMSHSSMMRSIACQLLDLCPHLFPAFALAYRQQGMSWDAFASLLTPQKEKANPRIICLLDGLDESEGRDDVIGKRILQSLADLSEEPGSRLRVLVLSRPYSTIHNVYGTYDILLEAENQNDIEKIIVEGVKSLAHDMSRSHESNYSSFALRRRAKLEGENPSDVAALSNEEIHAEMDAIHDYLAKNARGVTLWVTLCINQISRLLSRGPFTWASIRYALLELPLELDQMYATIIGDLNSECETEHRKMARKVLAWVITASTKRPLLIREMLDAISIPEDTITTTGDSDPIQSNRPIFTSCEVFCRSINEICGPLIEFVNPSEAGSFQYNRQSRVTTGSVVQLVHQTAKDFLETGLGTSYSFEPGEASRMVNHQASLYLNLAIPLKSAAYAPFLTDITDDWKLSVLKTLEYLNDKTLLSFVLSHCVFDKHYNMIAELSDRKRWRMSAFYQHMVYGDVEGEGVVDETVVGLLFRLGCNLGLDIAVENLLHLTSLRPGWWKTHLDVVRTATRFSAEGVADDLNYILTRRRDELNGPTGEYGMLGPVRHSRSAYSREYSRGSSVISDLTYARSPGRPESVRDSRHSLPGNTQRYSRNHEVIALPHNQDLDQVRKAISRVILYLSGNSQPLELNRGSETSAIF